MRFRIFGAVILCGGLGGAQDVALPAAAADPIKTLVGQLDLERYKATIKGLTQFGDRRQGTDRNRAAMDWIEAQLRSYGCSTERLQYEYRPAQAAAAAPVAGANATVVVRQGDATVSEGLGPGGARRRGLRIPEGVNNNPLMQADEKLRELNTQPAENGAREEVYCTKVGTAHPEEMYIVSAHMDGIGWGEAANDDGSGTALVMELARILSGPEVRTERSIRFALWNGEESGLSGARAYVAQRKDLQGVEAPAGSGRYPEPKWLGVIQHDMMLFDHGMPKADGTVSKEQRPEADVNIEYQVTSKLADAALLLAHRLQTANEKYATDYPAGIGSHMTNTDSTPFQDLTASLSLRESERGSQIGNGWDPQHHQPTDLYITYSDKDFRLGQNAAQTTLAAVAELAGIGVAPVVTVSSAAEANPR
ncbi:MAG: M28 family peptidase [Acidobacteriota bacterium]